MNSSFPPSLHSSPRPRFQRAREVVQHPPQDTAQLKVYLNQPFKNGRKSSGLLHVVVEIDNVPRLGFPDLKRIAHERVRGKIERGELRPTSAKDENGERTVLSIVEDKTIRIH